MHERLECVFIDWPLREGRGGGSGFLKGDLGVSLESIDASERFLDALKGVSDPEKKRKIIGKVFAEEFEEYARKEGPFRYLAQGLSTRT